ncbi:hypothetical protein DSO57_1007328 [Entomophthora muscae]|uniref:Uncharacterized protein n=1 Tax=Entomophthora muscae TaxID=34485 RepID=A0ACC2S9C4_9FUNG|nr:hypothetical protein DSO57_1007328 [Entomophthora muscae]
MLSKGLGVQENESFERWLVAQDSGRTIRNETMHPSPGLEGLRMVDIKFAGALANLRAITEDYIKVPFAECFNWDQVSQGLDLSDEGDWFVVVFRSIRSSAADSDKLYMADKLAHEEAKRSGGLLKYWYGDLNEHRECLATCIWANYQFARMAIVKPHHKLAQSLASTMYDSYLLERLSIQKKRGDPHLYISNLS